MKEALLLILIALSGCASKPIPIPVVPNKLSDTYAVPALFALKAIEGDMYYSTGDPPRTVNRVTQEKIDAADVLAVSAQERNFTNVLNSVYKGKLRLNQVTDDNGLPLNGYKAQSATLGKQLDMCYQQLDAALRARSTEIPATCKVSLWFALHR